MPLFAREVKAGQAVVLYDFAPKIMVRGDDVVTMKVPGKIPFCEIGTLKRNERCIFHSTPVNVVFLPDDQVFDLLKFSVD